jgi:hypothetical protein
MTRGYTKGPSYYALSVVDFDETNEEILPRQEHSAYVWDPDGASPRSSVSLKSYTMVDNAKPDSPKSAFRCSDQVRTDFNATEKGLVRHQPS